MATPQQVPVINYSNYPSSGIPAPHDHDVLCGRGGGTNNHSKSFVDLFVFVLQYSRDISSHLEVIFDLKLTLPIHVFFMHFDSFL